MPGETYGRPPPWTHSESQRAQTCPRRNRRIRPLPPRSQTTSHLAQILVLVSPAPVTHLSAFLLLSVARSLSPNSQLQPSRPAQAPNDPILSTRARSRGSACHDPSQPVQCPPIHPSRLVRVHRGRHQTARGGDTCLFDFFSSSALALAVRTARYHSIWCPTYDAMAGWVSFADSFCGILPARCPKDLTPGLVPSYPPEIGVAIGLGDVETGPG